MNNTTLLSDASSAPFCAPAHLDWTDEEQKLLDTNAMPSEIFAERIFEQLEAAPVLLTEDDVRTLDKRLREEWTHRAAFFFLMMDGKTLCRRIKEDRSFAVGAAAAQRLAAQGAEVLLNTFLEHIKQAQCRINIALCGREDMTEVLAEGGQLAADDHESHKEEGRIA